jgi:methyltransferase (TIGR00027 family)
LLVASGVKGYGPAMMTMSRKPWMQRVYRAQDQMLLPGQFEGFGHRKIFVDHQVLEAIDAGAGQVVIVGGGFDTLCLRRASEFPDVAFFEVDHPSTSAAKVKGVEKVGQPKNMQLIAADLSERSLLEVMGGRDGWDPTGRSVLVAEGLLQYLDDDTVLGLLRDAAACTAPGSRFALTHMIPEVGKAARRLVGLIGEPFLSFVTSEGLPEFVYGTGWTVISGVDANPEHGMERYAVLERTAETE